MEDGMAQGERVLTAEWLRLSDDELIHRIESLGQGHGLDAVLLDVVGSQRHFFVRQVAAKKIEDSKLMHEHWDDRHIGQILVRGLSRAEDVVYLEKLRRESRHHDVRNAAATQLRSIEFGRRASGAAPPPRSAG
jgi:hypothetical protein